MCIVYTSSFLSFYQQPQVMDLPQILLVAYCVIYIGYLLKHIFI
jgi:hypothetical protein